MTLRLAAETGPRSVKAARNLAEGSSLVQSTALAQRLRRNASHPIARADGTRLYLEVRPAWSWIETGLQAEAAPCRFLVRYIRGWAHADPAMIAEAAIDRYHFHDPLVGEFSGDRLSSYFEFLHTRFDCDGVRAQPAFHLRGPMDGCVPGKFAFFREAPYLGLTGIARILVGTRGVISETVAYDLNMATELLRRPHIDATR